MGGYSDLFGMNYLSVLMVFYGNLSTKGFWMIAVKPEDAHLLDSLRKYRYGVRGEIGWLFRWQYHPAKRRGFKKGQHSIPGLSDFALPAAMFSEEPYLWLPS